MTNYKQFLVSCSQCGAKTSKKYARANNGRCKECVTGIAKAVKSYRCPDCGRNTLSLYQKQHGYHCDICTRNVEQTGGIYGY